MMAALEKYMDNIPIRRKFMQLYIVCVLVPLIITDSVVLYIVGGMERERERHEMANIANSVSYNINSMVDNAGEIAKSIYTNKIVNSFIEKEYDSSSEYYGAYRDFFQNTILEKVLGMNQITSVKGGTGSGNVNVPYIVNGYSGLKNKEKQGKIKIYQPLSQLYIDAYKNGETQEPVVDQSVVNDAAKEADTALVFIGRNSGEGLDRQAVPGDYYLTEEELALVDEAVEAGFAHIVVIYNVGGMVDTSWMKDYPQIDGFVYAWQGGCEGGNSLADVICGDANPSGKLTDTLAASYDDYPASSDLLAHEDYMEYEEDIYVGYRYFETLAKDEVIYPFGYGLSYTTFEFSTPEVRVEDGKIYIEETITNTGTTAGKEVAQVYFSAPQGKLGKPEKELAAFEKTRELQPGESQTLTLSYDLSDMESYDDL